MLKKIRNCGKLYKYESSSTGRKTLKVREARAVKPSCGEKCKLACSIKLSEEDRMQLFSAYWDLANREKQWQCIANSMTTVQPHYRYVRVGGKRGTRKNNNAFNFRIGDQQIRVCKVCFNNTLNINDRPIRTVLEKKNQVANILLQQDLRGKHGKQKKIDPTIREAIRHFIDTIPKIESYCTWANSSRLYIGRSKTVAELHKDYESKWKASGLPFAMSCFPGFSTMILTFHSLAQKRSMRDMYCI